MIVTMALRSDSSDVMTSAIERDGGSSSSVIVNIAELSAIVAFFALERSNDAVSLFSSIESERMGTFIDPEELPAEIVNIPEVAVKSDPAIAVPLEVV